MTTPHFEASQRVMTEIERRVARTEVRCEDVSGLKDKSILKVSIPRLGGSVRDIHVTPKNASKYLDAGFENWIFIGDYLGVVNSETSAVELAILPTSLNDLRKLKQLCGYREVVGVRWVPYFSQELQVTFQSTQSELSVRIAPTTTALEIATDSEGVPNIQNVGASLFLHGLEVDTATESKALEHIQSVIDAVLFELSYVNQISIDLRTFPRIASIMAESYDVGPIPTVPKRKYSAEAVSLFRYAQSAERLPLLRFLAYYQVLEFFFPRFAEHEALIRLRRIVVDPLFNIDNPQHVSRLWEVVRGKRATAEIEQLKSTLQNCLDADELKNFIKAEGGRLKFLTAKNSPLKARKLDLNDHEKTSDIVDQVAARIYGIRCRIAHTKGGSELSDSDPLLPFSLEANHLENDIEIVRFVAQKVLIENAEKAPWS